MKTGRLTGLGLLHAHRDIDIDAAIDEFSRTNMPPECGRSAPLPLPTQLPPPFQPRDAPVIKIRKSNIEMEKQPLFRDQACDPPPYSTLPQPAQTPPAYGYTPQQTIVVVTQPTTEIYQRLYGTGNHYLLLSIVMSFVCFFFGTWLALFCTIPAICAAISAKDAEARGDIVSMERSKRDALCLNIAAIITGVVIYVIVVVSVIIANFH